jgi:hypothetical protein
MVSVNANASLSLLRERALEVSCSDKDSPRLEIASGQRSRAT